MNTAILTPNRPEFWGASDSETIQAAIAAAVADGSRQISIPRYNARCDRDEWRIMHAILLPDDFTVYLDNCYMVLEDGSYENMFTNEHSWELGYINKAENEQKNISIIGKGNAVLSGGRHNRMLEKTTGRWGIPSIYHNLIIYFNNCTGVRMENFRIERQRWWAIAHICCRNEVIRNLDFFTEPTVCNQDGIDLREGCHDFVIENITGRTGDDTVAFTALGGTSELKWMVEGKDFHIHDVKVRNIKSDAGGCYMLRLLNHDERKMYNIDVDTLMEASDYAVWKSRNNSPFCTGSPIYFHARPAQHGETYNINVRHVYSRSNFALTLNHTLKDSTFTDIKVFGDGLRVIGTWTETQEPATMENVKLEHVWFAPVQQEIRRSLPLPPDKYIGTAFDLHTISGELKMKDVHIEKVGKAFYSKGDVTVTVDGFTCEGASKFAVLGDKTRLIINNEVIEHE